VNQSNPAAADDLTCVPSRYVVGIDLGTTNCAMCFVDTDQEAWTVETFRIPQWVDVDQCEQLETLPSFHYERTAEEMGGEHRLPWERETQKFSVGVWARDAGTRLPGRRAASAKSWLCHDGVDRTADLLPWHGDEDVARLSPVEASARYLRHLRMAWDQVHVDHPLSEQDVVITLPASFDEVARELTVAAARAAGLPRVYLIEEPQAAFYAWISRQGEAWYRQVSPGQLILVCDIGGGTTDLTLIRVRAAGESAEQVQFHRVAVGKHLILGGDNMDLAVAKLAEAKLVDQTAQPLSPSQWDRLVQVSRRVKETMLSEDRPDSYTIHLPAQGSRLVGGALQVPLTADEVDQVLLEGFFPQVGLDEKPSGGESGFQEFGLPFAADPAITRHLAAFLSQHRRSGLEADETEAADRPDLILFNGGVLAASAVRSRITNLITRWFAEDDAWRPEVLSSPRLDLAVAQGAAYYAMVRRGQGVRIAANLGRSYYMQVEADPPRAICLIPGKAEAGQTFRTDNHPLHLKIGAPVQFPLWVSSTRLADLAGDLVDIDTRELSPLPPICTALMQGRRREENQIEVVMEAELSEIGTVGLYCVDPSSNKRWRLEFDIRSTLETDREAHLAAGESAGIVDAETIQGCAGAIEQVFAKDAGGRTAAKPGKLMKELQSILQCNRDAWPPSLLRELWQVLMDQQAGRRQSPQHESRWLNLIGFSLRPGYGVAVDDWRVGQTWRAVHGKLAFPDVATRCESMILWRRIAGGLSTGQQVQLAAPLISGWKNKSRRFETHEAAELWRLLGSLERLPQGDKLDLARLVMTALAPSKNEKLRPALLWAVGRIASRQITYGPLNATLSPTHIAPWVDALITMFQENKFQDSRGIFFLALVQMARCTGDRFRDLPPERIDQVSDFLLSHAAPAHYIDLLREDGKLTSEDEAAIFGESLPLGIHLVR